MTSILRKYPMSALEFGTIPAAADASDQHVGLARPSVQSDCEAREKKHEQRAVLAERGAPDRCSQVAGKLEPHEPATESSACAGGDDLPARSMLDGASESCFRQYSASGSSAASPTLRRCQ